MTTMLARRLDVTYRMPTSPDVCGEFTIAVENLTAETREFAQLAWAIDQLTPAGWFTTSDGTQLRLRSTQFEGTGTEHLARVIAALTEAVDAVLGSAVHVRSYAT